MRAKPSLWTGDDTVQLLPCTSAPRSDEALGLGAGSMAQATLAVASAAAVNTASSVDFVRFMTAPEQVRIQRRQAGKLRPGLQAAVPARPGGYGSVTRGKCC